MREDDAPESDQAQGSLADGLGQTPDDAASSAVEPYGDAGFDDGAYGDGVDDATDVDAADVTDTAGTADTGDGADDGDDLDPEGAEVPDAPTGGLGDALEDPLAQDASPLEGIGFLLDELHDALFGGDGDAAASAIAPDPADLTSGADLDLTSDGALDGADLAEAEAPFDLDVDELHDGHDGGVIDA